MTVGERVEQNLVWTYPEPLEAVGVIADHVAFCLDRVDAVYEESVRIVGHARDPYHRVDTLRSDRRVVVLRDEEVLAGTMRPMAVFETGRPPRWYIPRAAVRVPLTAGDTVSICHYEGVSSYWSLEGGPADVVWSYDEPLPEALGLADHVCLDAEGIAVQVDVTR